MLGSNDVTAVEVFTEELDVCEEDVVVPAEAEIIVVV